MKKLKLNRSTGEIVYRDDEGWKFYCYAIDPRNIAKIRAGQVVALRKARHDETYHDETYQLPELQEEIGELTLAEENILEMIRDLKADGYEQAINKNTKSELTIDEYVELLQREAEEFGITLNESLNSDTDFILKPDYEK